MKRKHFIIALMAMLFSFSFTTSAQQLLVNCDYNSSTEGWGTTKFSNYAGAYAYATANSKTSATIVIEKTNTLSGNTFDNNHKNYSKLAVVIQDGATMGNAASKWDMTYPVTVKPGGTLTCARPKTASVSNIHIKNTLTVGEKGSTKKAYVNFLSDSYQDCDISIRYNGKILVYNADFAVQDLDAQGTLTIEDSEVAVDGAFACATTFYKTTLTNTNMVVNGNQIEGGLSDFKGGDSNQLGNITITNSSLTINEGTTKVAANVTVTGSEINVENLTVNSGKTINLNEGSTLNADGEITNNGTVKIDGVKAEISGGQAFIPVAQIGEQKYATLNEALEATKTMTGDVTVEIYDKVTFNQPLIGNYTSINFVGKETDAEMYLDVQGYTTATGKKVSFEDLTLSKSEGGFIANAGFMNVAFGLYEVAEVTYTNCTFANGAYASSGKVTYTGCTFKKSWDKYGLWAYGDADITVDGCTFADYRGVKMYAENGADASTAKPNLAVKNTNFSAVDNKPAIVLTYGESVVLEGNTYSSTGTFELDLDGKPNGVAVTSDVAPVCVNDNGACGVLVDGKIYTTVAQAAEVATETSTVTLLHSSNETVEFPMGTTIEKNGFTADNVTIAQPFAEYVVLPTSMTVNNYKALFGTNTVTDGTNYYATLQAAVEAVAQNAGVTRQANAVLYCKPGADVGSLQHAPVVGTLTIYGNGANVTGGSERDFDLGNTDPSGGKDITADMTLTVKHLNGCGAWGAKATDHAVNLVFENCANMGKVFITGTTGTLNITMTDCAFEGVIKEAVYSNADGAITLNNVAFSNLNKAINLNHKAAGTQTVTINGCSFTNCGADVAADQIPVRVLSSVDGGKTVLNVSNATFTGTPEGGADILLDYGVGETTASVTATAANVFVEKENNVATKTTVTESEGGEFTNVVPVAKVNGIEYMTLAEAVAAAQAGDEIVLIADVKTTDGVVITDKNLTIDLNGKTYTVTEGANTNNRNFKINGTSVVTVKNGTMVAAGQYSSGAYGTIRTEGTANVTLTGLKLYNYRGNGLNIKACAGTTVTIENTEIYANYGGGIESAGGTIVVNNGVTVEQKGMYTAPYNSMAISVNGGGKVTVNGGTFSTECITAEEANNQGTSHGPWVAGVLNSGGTLIINGGTFSNDNFGENSLATAARGAILADTKAKVAINGGTFNVLKNVIDIQNNLGDTNNNPSVLLVGGTYSADPRISAQYGSNLITLAEDYIAVMNNGVWNVVKAVAKIGTTAYATLDEAVKAAQVGDKITLLNDADLAFAHNPQYNNVYASEIDLNGKTMTIKKGDVRFDNVTIKNGNIIVQPGTYSGTAIFLMYSKNLTFDAVKVTATGVAAPAYLIGLEGTSNLNLLNGSEIVINNESLVNIGSIIADNGKGNTVTIKDSKIEITNSNARLYLGGTNGKITVENSDIDLNGVKEGFYLRAGQTLAITGTSTVDITLNSTEGRYGINLTDLTATFTKAETATVNATVYEIKVAKVGENTYRTLAQAVAAVEDGGTITLIANETFTKNNRYNNSGWWDGLGYSGDKSFTIDLADFTISQDGALNDYLMWFKNDGAKANTITLKNGTLDAGTTAYSAFATASSNAQKITVNLENINVINNNSNGAALKIRGGSELNVKAGTIITGQNSYLGIEAVGKTTVVNIYEGAEIYQNGTSSSWGCLVGASGNGTVNVYGGKGQSARGGFMAMTSGGTINISGGEWTANSDGTYANDNKGVLIAQSDKQYNAGAGNSVVNVTGGTFKGGYNCYGNKAGDAQINIKGGNFNADPTSYVAEDYIAVKNNSVWNVVKAAAKIGTQKYVSLQEAVNAVQNGETIVLGSDITESVTLTEKVGLYYTIDGNGKTMYGKITITPLSDENDNRRITIKDINFVNTADAAVDFISCAVTNHYPRLTVEGCTFTGNGKDTDVALRLKTAYGAVIKDCTGTGLHSFLQNTAGKELTIENVTVTASKSGFALGTVQGVTVKGANIDVAGYGIRMDAQYNNNAVIESNTVKAFIPVVVRKAEVNSDVTVKGENTMTATNTDGIWFAAGTSEYETNGTMPTAATGKVKVTLEDKKLDLNGVYGNYGVASIGNAKFNTLAEAVNAAQAGSEIKLLADVTLAGGYEDAAEGLRIEKEITLNGNGYTINCGNFLKGIRIYNPSNVGDFNVNFENITVVNNVVNGRCIDTRSGNINLKVNSSTLIATNGNSQPLTIGGNDPVHRVSLNKTSINAGASGYAVISFVSTNVDIQGVNNSTISGFAAFYLKGDAKTTTLNLGQGIYTGTNNHAVESGVFGTIVLEGDNNVVNLMGTNATVKAIANNTAPQAAFLVRGANNTIKITKESAKIITEGNAYEAMVKADNAATTKFVDMGIERKLVAENRGYQFYSFEEAVRFAGNEGTIKIVNDFELAEAWTVAAGQNITLDLNGKTVSMVYAKDATANHTMISNSGNLTIQSSVEGGKLSYTYTGANLGTSHSANTVTSNPGSVLTVKSGTIENLTFDSGIIAYAIDGLTNGGAGDVTVNIEGGVITSKRQAVRIFANSTTNTGALNISDGELTGRVIVQNASAKANKAALEITGGTFNANEYKNDVLYVGGSSSATIDINATVRGGTFNGEITETNVAGFISGGTFANPVAPEFCAAGFMPNKNTDGTYGVVVASGMVATTNGFGYATLAEAIKACVAGDNTITLLADCAEKVTITQVNGTNITINGNGKTYTGTITIKGDKVANNLYNTETLTFKNINFAPAYNTYAITAEKNTYARNITVDGCTFKGNNDVYGIRVRNGYNYTVKNTTVEGVYTFFNASEALNGLTVENVTVKCASVAFSGAYGYGNASFKNVTVESGNNGIKVNNPNSSALTFENCSITAKAPVTFYENAGVTSALTAEFNGTNTMVVSEGGTYWFNIVEADATDATFKAIVNDAALDMSNTAFAASVGNVYYSSLQKAIDAAVDGDVVTLAKNIELDAANCVTNSDGYSVFVNVVGKAVTIDLNGKAVTANLSASQFASAKSSLLMAVLSVDTNGNLTLNDSKGTGKVAVTANDASVYSLISNYDSSAKLTINGGSYELDKARAKSSLIHSDPSEAVVVNGGNFYLGNVNTGANGSPWIFNVNGNNTGHVIVNGGTFNYDINHQYWAFEVHVDKALTLKNNGDGTWTVVPAVAYVVEENNGYTRETGYETLKEAMSSKYGNEVTLLVDVDTTEVILIDKPLTINGNGHKVASSATRVFRVTTGDTEVTLNGVSMVSNAVRVGTNDIRGISIDIVNNVKLTLNNSSVDFTDASANDWAYALNVTGGENHVVTVNGGTYEGANVINVRGANNAVTVKDATLTSTYPNNDQYFGACIWVLQNQNSSVEATGNTFNGSNAIAFNLGTGTALTESENIDNTKMIVAKVDSEYYTSLAEAVAAADGNTVKILHSFDTDETATVNGDVTLDLNGKTITGTPSEAKAYAVITNKGTLTITGNGTVLCDHKLAGSTGYAVNTITNLGTLNIEDGVTIENKSTAQHQIGYAIDNNSTSTDAVVNIKGGKVTASGSLYYDGIRQFCNSETKENSVVVEGGEVSTIWMQNPSDGATKNTKDVKGSIAISGGNVGVLSLEPSASFEAAVTGGHVGEISHFQTAAGRDLVEFVTDGTFGTKIDEAFLALGYQLTGDAAPYGVKYTGKREALTIDVAEYKDEYKNTQKLSVKTLTFKRKLNAGAWNAFFVPFEVPLKDLMENYDVAYLNDASFYDRDENGSIEEITVQYVKFTEAHKNKKLFANHPYRIRPKNATVANMNLVLTDVELQTTEKDKRKVLRCGGVYTNIEWHGLYERSYATDFLDGNNSNDMCFAENSKGTFQNIGEYSVAPFRVMMVMTNSDEMPYTFDEEALANVRAITLGEDEFDATGIINIGSDQEKSDLIFDLQGRRVLSPVKGNLYIINGKKVVY